MRQGRDGERGPSDVLQRGWFRDIQSLGVDAEFLLEAGTSSTLDRVTIRRARRAGPLLSFEHILPDRDPLLWLPRSFAWSVGTGGDWRAGSVASGSDGR